MPRPASPTSTHAASPAPASRSRLSADERRADIVEAALRAFASGGLHGTSTEDVARLAGVSQPYLFRLFGTKKDLFLAAVDGSFSRIEAIVEGASRRAITDSDSSYSPVLAAIGARYGGLLKDQSLLRMQLH